MELKADKVIFGFSKENEPALRISAGETVEIETKDCFSNQLRLPEDKMECLDWTQTNPATGPIYVEGAKPGDVLKVKIEQITLDEKGVIVTMENEGTLGHLLKGTHTQIIPVKDGMARFMDQIEIPIKPMIGVIGVAPGEGTINTGTPGAHGGNMDNTMMGEGATA
ncbi:MAG: acetamidase/formamidase family protein, partial [Anaerovoracaceae bacterium]